MEYNKYNLSLTLEELYALKDALEFVDAVGDIYGCPEILDKIDGLVYNINNGVTKPED